MRQGRGPRQPGGGRQMAGPRDDRSPRKQTRGKPKPAARKSEKRGEEGRAFEERSSKPRSFEGRRAESHRDEGRAFEGRSAEGRGRDGFKPRGKSAPGSRARPAHDERRRTERPVRESQRERPPETEHEASPEVSKVQVSTKVETVTVSADESGMRIDRFLEARFPGLSFSHIQRVIRKGELRVNGKRVDAKDRLEEGQSVRIPPLKLDQPKRAGSEADEKTLAFLKSIILYEDADVLVLNKPMGLAVQGGSGTVKHVDGMLDVLRDDKGQRPRLVHRLDKDTAGCLLVAKTRFAASALAKSFRSRSARKIYWALVVGVPKPRQGRISTFLAKEEVEEDSFMRIAKHGEEGASHAVTYYAVVETAAHQLAWVSLKPVTGRTHQLRAHMAHIEHPIVGDPKYFNKENWQLPGGIQNRLHLHARRIAIPHPRGGVIDVTSPLPPHMVQSWNLLGFDAKRYDPIEEAPEED